MISNFLFHRVNPERDALWDPMDVSLFEKCIQYISRKYEVVLLEDYLLNVKPAKSEGKIATIVFDDGYKDNLEYALPILEKFQLKASFYVVVGCIENNIPTWTHVLDYTFQKTIRDQINLQHDFLPTQLRVRQLKTHEERINYVRKLKPLLKKISHQDRMQVLNTVLTAFDDVALPQLMMTWDDLKQVKHAGHYVGSHTVSHSMLGTMDNKDDIRKELTDSARKIQEVLGHFPITISYPVGSYNDTVINLAREAGYKIGLAVNQIPYDPATHDSYEIPRIELYNEPWIKTRLRIDNIYGTLSKLFRR